MAAGWNVLFIYLGIMNLLAFFAFGIDKRKAKRGAWRIPEKTLMLFSVLGGSIGALAGMYTFHHKTKKPKFYIGNWAILFVQIVVVIMILRTYFN